MKKILLAVVVLAVVSACNKPTDKKAELEKLKNERTALNDKITKLESEVGGADKTKKTVKEVTVITLAEGRFDSYLQVQGKIDADENVQVSPEVQGTVTSVFVKVGDHVSKGQVIAQVDDKVLKQTIAEIQTQLDLATNLYNRQKNLWDQKIGTEVQFINAKTQKESVERKLATTRSQIAMYKVKSPISGTIDQFDLKVGQAASPGMPGIRVVNSEKLKVKANIAESYANVIHEGDQVKILFPDARDSIKATIHFASKVIDPVTRSFNVEIKLPTKKIYRPNMIAILKIVDYNNAKAISIPVNVIQKSETNDYVFVADNGVAKRVDIKTGKVSDGKAEVLSGLKAGDKVLAAGVQNVNNGDSIKF